MTATTGVPTEAVRDALVDLDSVDAVATWFEIPRGDVEDAPRFGQPQRRPVKLEAA